MKNIYILTATALLTLFTGCSDFLNQDLKSDIPGADYYGTAEGFESLSNAAYSSLRTIYGGDPWLFEGGTDLFATGRTSVPTCNLYSNAYSAAEENVQTFYTNHYKAISLTNEVIYWGEKEASRAGRIDEARGLRALFYLNLVQQFGGVPMITERSATPITGIARSSATDVYGFIISEMGALSTSVNLPESATDGRFNRKAAYHYLAKALLSRGYLIRNNCNRRFYDCYRSNYNINS